LGFDAVVDELVGAEADPGAEQDEEASVPVRTQVETGRGQAFQWMIMRM